MKLLKKLNLLPNRQELVEALDALETELCALQDVVDILLAPPFIPPLAGGGDYGVFPLAGGGEWCHRFPFLFFADFAAFALKKRLKNISSLFSSLPPLSPR